MTRSCDDDRGAASGEGPADIALQFMQQHTVITVELYGMNVFMRKRARNSRNTQLAPPRRSHYNGLFRAFCKTVLQFGGYPERRTYQYTGNSVAERQPPLLTTTTIGEHW